MLGARLSTRAKAQKRGARIEKALKFFQARYRVEALTPQDPPEGETRIDYMPSMAPKDSTT
ncbi:transposase IS66 [Caballeronia calidae]|uniref:Transposase IS66 n=1 Tax=Caballeronia calidae TaxID=1777139 RepID=A0A158EJ93_9BURK|nr:transposase IS66 [Caballeronia calidae]